MLNQPSILIGREAHNQDERDSIARAHQLGKVNDELAVSLAHRPCGAYTVDELMWLMDFIQRHRIADREDYEKSVNEILKQLAESALTAAEIIR